MEQRRELRAAGREAVSAPAGPTPRGLRRHGTAALLALCLAGGAVAGEPAATPQRPSLSTSAWTVPRGLFELEAGAGVTEGAGALPLFAKYGLRDSLELAAGIDGIRWVDGPGDGETSVGDLSLVARWRPAREAEQVALALAGSVKLPTAGDEAGSGELDGTVVGIASIPLRKFALDLNVVWSALGRDGGGALGQGQAIATLGVPLRGGWSSFLEAAYQQTAGAGDGGFFDTGLSWAATPRAVLDVAAGIGWSEGYPEWSATVGWTVLFASRRDASRVGPGELNRGLDAELPRLVF